MLDYFDYGKHVGKVITWCFVLYLVCTLLPIRGKANHADSPECDSCFNCKCNFYKERS